MFTSKNFTSFRAGHTFRLLLPFAATGFKYRLITLTKSKSLEYFIKNQPNHYSATLTI